MNKLTPFAAGQMPEDVKRWDDGPPFGRIEIELDDEDMAKFDALSRDDDDVVVVFDLITCEEFKVRRAPCDLGCFCAAEARWANA